MEAKIKLNGIFKVLNNDHQHRILTQKHMIKYLRHTHREQREFSTSRSTLKVILKGVLQPMYRITDGILNEKKTEQ